MSEWGDMKLITHSLVNPMTSNLAMDFDSNKDDSKSTLATPTTRSASTWDNVGRDVVCCDEYHILLLYTAVACS